MNDYGKVFDTLKANVDFIRTVLPIQESFDLLQRDIIIKMQALMALHLSIYEHIQEGVNKVGLWSMKVLQCVQVILKSREEYDYILIQVRKMQSLAHWV